MPERVLRKGTLLHCSWDCKLIHPLWKTVWIFLQKLGIKPLYDPEIPILVIYPEEIKIIKDTCIPLSIAALFTIARTWKHPRCPSTDEWMKKLWPIFTMEYSVQFSSVTQSCLTLQPVDCSIPGLPVYHQLPEFTQSPVHWIGDTIQPSHSLLSASPLACNLSRHQGLFKWVSSSHQVA